MSYSSIEERYVSSFNSIEEKYADILESIEEVNENLLPIYAKEFACRHRLGYRIPISTYTRCKDILFYKESLHRPSPYYRDLFSITNEDHLKTVILDLYMTIQLRYDKRWP